MYISVCDGANGVAGCEECDLSSGVVTCSATGCKEGYAAYNDGADKCAGECCNITPLIALNN